MLDLLFYFIAIPFILALISYFIVIILKSGLFDKTEVSLLDLSTKNDPKKLFSQPITIYYKFCVEPWKNSPHIYKELNGLIPHKSLKFFKLNYFTLDRNSSIIKVDQSAIGCFYQVGSSQLFEHAFASQLTRWNYEKMVLPPLDRVIHARQSYDGLLSKYRLGRYTYPKLIDFLRLNSFSTSISIELLNSASDKNYIDVFLPLDHFEELTVAEYMDPRQVESKLAYKRFHSDSSESEDDESESPSISISNDDLSEKLSIA